MVEVITVTLMLGILSVSSASFFQGIHRVFSRLPTEVDVRIADRAMDQVVARLQRADSSSIDWTLVPPSLGCLNDSLTFRVSTYDIAHPDNPTVEQVTIAWNATHQSLEETITGITPATPASTRLLLSNVEPPTAAVPLFELDPTATSVLMVRVKVLQGVPKKLRIIERRARLL